jgi:hypothetical protein
MIQLVRQQAMSAPMPGQEINQPARDFAADEKVGRRPKWRLNLVLSRVGQSFHLVETTSSDNSDRRLVCLHARRDYSKGEKVGKRIFRFDPHRSLAVEGFRESPGSVAAFRFSAVRESYAQEKYHQRAMSG